MTSSPEPAGFRDLVALLGTRRTVVLSGAGCSTESGIPDYRGPRPRRKTHDPIQYRAFMDDPATRTRYWARSAAGWSRFAGARPNAGHVSLARLEAHTCVNGVITQNVDRLHHAAGSRRVLELHGALAEVRCLSCSGIEDRDALQRRILDLNPGWTTQQARPAPDGDAHVAPDRLAAFRIPGCVHCGGVLKPNVVFFGESVPKARVQTAWQMLDDADALLVVGSSLAVYSGYRFVRGAVRDGKPVAIVNVGPTRGDDLAAVRVEGYLGDVLPRLADALGAPPLPAHA